MTVISQAIPCLFGGVVVGSINALVGLSAAATTTLAEGFVIGSMGAVASNIISSRAKQVERHYQIETPILLALTHVTTYVLMVLSFNSAHYIANKYLTFQVPQETIKVVNILSLFMSVPIVGVRTFNSINALREQ